MIGGLGAFGKIIDEHLGVMFQTLWRNACGNIEKPSKQGWCGGTGRRSLLNLILPLAEPCFHIPPHECTCGRTDSLHVHVPSAALQKASTTWPPPGARGVCPAVGTLLGEIDFQRRLPASGHGAIEPENSALPGTQSMV